MALECAPGGPGRPELLCVGSTGGGAIHLLDPTVNEVLCHGLRSGKIRIGPGLEPFEFVGCRRCASEAVRRGYPAVRDGDGDQLMLAGFIPVVHMPDGR